MEIAEIRHPYPVALPLPTPFPVGPVNVYLYLDDPVTLVDTGTCTAESWNTLEAGLHAYGITVGDIRRIFVTHHHVDHVGLVRRIVDVSGAEVFGHPNVAGKSAPGQTRDEAKEQYYFDLMSHLGVPEAVRRQSMLLWDEFRTYSEPFSLNGSFEDGGRCGPFTTLFVPGHSSTDTLLIHESGSHTLVGDHILQGFNPNPLLRRAESGQPRGKSLVEYQQSLHRSRSSALARCLPGHGEPIEDFPSVIDGILHQHERRNARIMELIPGDGASPFAVAAALYPKIEPQYLYLALSVAVGHLELLECRGQLQVEPREGVLHYLRRPQEYIL